MEWRNQAVEDALREEGSKFFLQKTFYGGDWDPSPSPTSSSSPPSSSSSFGKRKVMVLALAQEKLCLHDVVVEDEGESFAEPLRIVMPRVEGRRYPIVSKGLFDKVMGQVM